MMNMITIDEFSKIEVRVGTVKTAERVPDTDKLLRLTVDFAEETGPRQIVSGINAYVNEPEDLIGRQFAFVTNLEPRTIRGLESNGMLFSYTRSSYSSGNSCSLKFLRYTYTNAPWRTL
jgi:methionyl-tRNA synthetase